MNKLIMILIIGMVMISMTSAMDLSRYITMTPVDMEANKIKGEIQTETIEISATAKGVIDDRATGAIGGIGMEEPLEKTQEYYATDLQCSGGLCSFYLYQPDKQTQLFINEYNSKGAKTEEQLLLERQSKIKAYFEKSARTEPTIIDTIKTFGDRVFISIKEISQGLFG